METNPRIKSPGGEWYPPPPVKIAKQGPPPLPPRAKRISAEEDFEATLGSLVDQFTRLPPPVYGEPPEIAAAAPERKDAEARTAERPSSWIVVGSLLLGCVVAYGALLAWKHVHVRPAAATAPVMAAAFVPVATPSFNRLKLAPRAEALLIPKAVAARLHLRSDLQTLTPRADLPVQVKERKEDTHLATAALAPAKKKSSAKAGHSRGQKTQAARLSAGPSAEKNAAGAGEGGGEWEDPYR
jgi:hypothetical protein